MSTPSGEQNTEEALNKVHQFFDEFEMKTKAFLGHLSGDARELFTKLRGQVHQDVEQASGQVHQDIAEGKTDVSEAVAGEVPSANTPANQPAQGAGVGQPLPEDPSAPSA